MKTKKENRNGLLKSVVLTGMIAGAIPIAANAGNMFSYEYLGSGSQLRNSLIEKYVSPSDVVNNSSENFVFEAKCGEGKCGEKKEPAKKQETKKEGKEKATKAKTAEKAEKAEKGKTKEAKCGEGKCGEKK